jgi:hypothetical protein
MRNNPARASRFLAPLSAIGSLLLLSTAAFAQVDSSGGNSPQAQAGAPAGSSSDTDETWSLHGQTTFTEQYHPAFTSPYRGANSLDPGSRGDETVALKAERPEQRRYRPKRGGKSRQTQPRPGGRSRTEVLTTVVLLNFAEYAGPRSGEGIMPSLVETALERKMGEEESVIWQ